jgi:hypothetical protein
MAVAFVALLVALGGTSYAAVKLANNSVQTKHIKNRAVTGAKVKNNALTGAHINEASLQGVKSGEAAHAVSAAGIDKVYTKSAPYAVATAPQVPCPGTPAGSCFTPLTQFTAGSVNCDAGQVAVGGGARPDDFNLNTVVESYPAGASGWAATVGNDDVTRPHGFNVFVLCVPGSPG